MYATQQNMLDRFGEDELLAVADRDDDAAIDTDLVAAALSDAASVIDSYIATRYDLPLADTPAQLTKIACDIARYNLYTDAPHERVTEAYKAAIGLLRDIATGKARLDIAGDEPTADQAGSAEIQSAERLFSANSLKGF